MRLRTYQICVIAADDEPLEQTTNQVLAAIKNHPAFGIEPGIQPISDEDEMGNLTSYSEARKWLDAYHGGSPDQPQIIESSP